MEKVILTKYKSKVNDILFDTEEECLRYERGYDEVTAICNILPEIKKLPYDGFMIDSYQHDISKFEEFKERLFEYIRKIIDIKDEPIIRYGRVYRWLNDSNYLINKAFYRYQCIDDNGKEYNMPLYIIRRKCKDCIKRNSHLSKWDDKLKDWVNPNTDKMNKILDSIIGE